MTDLVFEPFPKMPRLKRGCVITEKVDGSNGQINFDEDGNVLVGSRKRPIFPEGSVVRGWEVVKGTDNFGFAGWVHDNREVLFEALGPGRHYGEWAGPGIQRGYDLDHKRFYLFNTWRRGNLPIEAMGVGLDVVPILYTGEFTSTAVDDAMRDLITLGSYVDGTTKPEGVVVYLPPARAYYKITFDGDKGKWEA